MTISTNGASVRPGSDQRAPHRIAAVAVPQLDLRPDDHVLVVSTEGATDPDAYRRIIGADPKDII